MEKGLNVDLIEEAFRPLAKTLAADGYALEVASATREHVDVRIAAGLGACADCLVPKEVFTSIAADRLAKAGFNVSLVVTYPADVPA